MVLLLIFIPFFFNTLLASIVLSFIEVLIIYSTNLFDFLDLNSIQLKVSEKVVVEHSLFSQKNFLLSKIITTFLSWIGKS